MVITRELGKMQTHWQSTRPPAVAGQFYPAEPNRLRAQVQRLLADACPRPGVTPKALIAPHAGYAYSGAIAAAAFSALRTIAHTIKRVVLAGPAHYVSFSGIAAPTVERFKTPLGDVAVDVKMLDRIVRLPFVLRSDAPHAPEHALEVELPFLQIILPSFKIVPLIVGDVTPHEVAAALHETWDADETLIVVSSDLSHYLGYEAACRTDSATAAVIEGGEWSALGPNHACGYLPVAGLLIESERRGLQAQRLALCNSGDTGGPRDQVVGYGAWNFHRLQS
jgi:AmmeMemoRadiSam system protein B